MRFWLLKTEPDEFSIDDLAAAGAVGVPWDGIRNYQARNYLRDQVSACDRALIYHSSCAKAGVAGVGRVVCDGYPDPAQLDPDSRYYDPKATQTAPRWYQIDLMFERRFDDVIPLVRLKQTPALASMVLIRHGRLSVQPVTLAEWNIVLALGSNPVD